VADGTEAAQVNSEEAEALNWLQRGRPRTASLVATTTVALSALAVDHGSGVATVEETIRFSALALLQWLTDDPCPVPGLGDRCELFVSRYRFLCLEIGSDRDGLPDDHVELMIDRLSALNDEFEKFLVELQERYGARGE
jgi:hypothetical protein